VNKTRTW